MQCARARGMHMERIRLRMATVYYVAHTLRTLGRGTNVTSTSVCRCPTTAVQPLNRTSATQRMWARQTHGGKHRTRHSYRAASACETGSDHADMATRQALCSSNRRDAAVSCLGRDTMGGVAARAALVHPPAPRHTALDARSQPRIEFTCNTRPAQPRGHLSPRSLLGA